MTKSNSSAWYHQCQWSAVIVVVALLAAYGMASLAINSGSLMQYGITIILLILAFNRFCHVISLVFKRKIA